ncbi:MAG: urea transporter [Alistipes sp.]|nr:urea transporter [Alistipes sp.]
MTQTIVDDGRREQRSSDFIKVMLRGTGQVMFQNNVWTGLLFLCGIFWGSYETHTAIVSWGALVGLLVSSLTGYILGYPRSDGEQGLWGFNGVLVGCAFPTFMGNTVQMWVALIICAALTVWVRRGMNKVMAPLKVNSFTFPFVFCTWIFLLAARAMHGIPPEHMSDPAMPDAVSGVVSLSFADLVAGWLRGISQVFLIDSWWTGLLFLIGLAVSNRWAALWAAVGSAVAVAVAMLFGASSADVAHGLYGFSPVLTAIALATVFYRPNVRSALWALVGIVVTVFVQAAMNVAVEPLGVATLTAPFCVTTWLFLLPLMKLDAVEKPDHSDWDKRHKPHLGGTEPEPAKDVESKH